MRSITTAKPLMRIVMDQGQRQERQRAAGHASKKLGVGLKRDLPGAAEEERKRFVTGRFRDSCTCSYVHLTRLWDASCDPSICIMRAQQ